MSSVKTSCDARGRTTSCKAKKLECLAVTAFGAPRLPVRLLPIPHQKYHTSFLMASNYFWGSTEIDENVSLTLL